jgi:hypothetical protein
MQQLFEVLDAYEGHLVRNAVPVQCGIAKAQDKGDDYYCRKEKQCGPYESDLQPKVPHSVALHEIPHFSIVDSKL